MFLRGYVTKYVTAQPFVSGARFSIGQSFCEPQPAVRSDRHQTAGYTRETRRLQHADLPQKADLVVEQVFLDDLPVLPSRDCAELECERLSCRRMDLPVQPLPRADHLSRPFGDGAGPVSRGEHHLVRVVVEMVFYGLEERLGLGLMSVSAERRGRLPGPVHRRVRRMPLPEHLPVLRIPRVIQRLHSLKIVVACHVSLLLDPCLVVCPARQVAEQAVQVFRHGRLVFMTIGPYHATGFPSRCPKTG